MSLIPKKGVLGGYQRIREARTEIVGNELPRTITAVELIIINNMRDDIPGSQLIVTWVVCVLWRNESHGVWYLSKSQKLREYVLPWDMTHNWRDHITDIEP